MKKFYCRISGNHTTYVKAGGVEKRIVFDNSRANPAGFGEFVTDDMDLVRAMTDDPRCGSVWFADMIAVEEKKIADVPLLTGKVCRTVNEAIEWLSGLGFQKNRINTSEKAIEAARSAGYELRFEKETAN